MGTQSAISSSESAAKWNRDHYQGYLNAVENAKTNGGNAPPIISPPVLSTLQTPYDPSKPYFRLEDIRAREIFCHNEIEPPIPPDTWNWSKVF